ncbi:HAMP domain-containing protein [candidate division WOR-3 bacterium]|nr:HAMP domain-containing protein [candidate division WOR-3 bacterium]
MGNNNHDRRRLSIRGRIALAMIFSAILVLPVTILALYYASQMNSLANVIAEEDTELLRTGNTIVHNFLEVRNLERNFLIYNDTFYLSAGRARLVQIALLCERARRLDPKLTQNFDSLINALLTYRRLLDSLFMMRTVRLRSPARSELQKLRETHRQMVAELEETQNPRLKDSLLTAISLIDQEIERTELTGIVNQLFAQRMNETAQKIITAGEKIMAHANQRIAEHKSRITRLFNWSQRNIISAIIVLTAVLVYLIVRLPRSIVLPIKRINNALIRAEQGDLNIRVTLPANDELGDLARQLNRAFAHLRDFDERKANYILELERRFRLLANNINEGVIVFDREPKIVYANPAAEPFLGIKSSDSIGHNIKDLPNLAVLKPRLEQILSGSSSHQECEILPELPGSALCFETLRDRNGAITGAIVIITNPAPPEMVEA